jgi:putative endonuclease
MREYYLYLLECSDGSYYLGVTNDISQRIRDHQEGFNRLCYTYKRRPVVLLHYLTFNYIGEAIYWEKRLKKWSRAKKKAFFTRNWQVLHIQAKCRNKTSHKRRSSEDETSWF